MTPWPIVALGDIFSIARGGSPRPIDKFITDEPDGINWVMIGDATAKSKYITKTKKKIKPSGVCRSRMVKSGDFLLTNSMSFGHPYIMKTSGCIHDGWLVLSPQNGKIDPDYFYHLLGSDAVYSEFARRAAGATVKNLNIDLVKGVKISLPPFDEQKRVAAILDQADALRRLRQRALDRLNTLGQSIFYEKFGDPISNEKGFELSKVGDFVENFDTGKNVAADPDVETTAPFRVLKVSAVTSGFYKPEESKPLPIQYQPPSSHIVHDGDLLFSRANTSELIGATAFVKTTPEGIALPDKIWRFRWKNSCPVEPLFVQHLFSSPAFRREISKRATGTSGSMKNISKPKVLSIEAGIPHFKEQQKFATIFQSMQKPLRLVMQQRVTLESLFSSLQHRAFRGEL